MNASDIAKDLDREGKFPGHVCYGTSPLLVRAANMLRKQQTEIEMLKKLLDDFGITVTKKAQEKMTTQELIDALDQRYGNPNAKGLELIQEAIRVLRYQHEELEALMDQIK